MAEERLLVIKGVGVQLSTLHRGGHTSSRFIDQQRITRLVINEGITMYQVGVGEGVV